METNVVRTVSERKFLKVKFVCLSDLHNDLRVVTKLFELEFDALLIAGDLTNFGTLEELKVILEALDFGKPIIFTAGNHDGGCAKKEFKKILKTNKNLHYLENSYVKINGITIYGMPQTLRFKNWWFMVNKEADFEKYLPKEHADILLFHQPPAGVGLATVESAFGEHDTGSEAVRAFLESSSAKYCITGHIHEHEGEETFLGPVKVINAGLSLKIIEV